MPIIINSELNDAGVSSAALAAAVAAAIPPAPSAAEVAAAVAASVPPGATPAQVAAAVVSALPAQPTAAAIAAAVVSSMPTPATVLQGQAVEFEVGKVPAGYAQVAGGDTVLPADTGFFGYINLQNKIGYAYSRICQAGTRLYAIGSSGSGSWYVQELAGDYSKIGSAVAVPSLNAVYPALIIPLSDGKMLRLGGDSSTFNSSQTQVFNPATGAFTGLANKPTAASCLHGKAAQAGNGTVYGVLVQSSNVVSAFNYGANTWTDNVATAPATADNTIGMCKLPSGKLFWATTTGQYVFDPAALTFTQVGSYAVSGGVNGGAVIDTDSGARLYAVLGSTIVFYEYTEASNTWATVITDTPKLSSPSTTTDPAYGVVAARNPYNGAVVVKSQYGNKSDAAYLHLLRYTPKATVKAVKL